ncbi:MAG: hypothetical protein ACQERW_01330 [Cyanobacteriota bacterium]
MLKPQSPKCGTDNGYWAIAGGLGETPSGAIAPFFSPRFLGLNLLSVVKTRSK